MNYAQIRAFDVANGLGVRTTLFVSGCTHDCEDCFNKDYQDFRYGNEWTQQTEDRLIDLLKNENIAGLSVLGGEPLQQSPRTMYNLFRRVKEETGKNIWLWTGYEYENIPKPFLPCLEYIDVLVDGKYEKSLKNLKLQFRGSSNQRVIDVQQSLKDGEVVLYNL